MTCTVVSVRGVSDHRLQSGQGAPWPDSLPACSLRRSAWEAASVPPRAALSRAGLESKAQVAVSLVAKLGIIFAPIGAGILAGPHAQPGR